jgi:hypothetical protein
VASAEDYPYDPNLDVNSLRDLDKLRAVQDRRTAQWLFEIWQHITANEKSIEARLQDDERQRARAHREHLLQLASAVKRGTYGLEAKALWEELTQSGRDDSIGVLERLAHELRRGGLQRIPGRQGG